MKFRKIALRLALVLIVLAGRSLESISQTCPDSSQCIPNAKLRSAAKLIEKGKLDSAELGIQRQTNMLLTDRIAAKDNVITQYVEKERNFNLILANYESQKGIMLDQVAAANSRVTVLQKQVRRERRKTVITGIGGVLLAGLTLYLTSK